MDANIKRFTISITPSMEKELNVVKEECYCKDSRSEMLQDLIVRGLKSLHDENCGNVGAETLN